MLKRMSPEHAGETVDCVERARRLAPLIAEAAPRVESERQIPQDVLAALHAARLFRLLIPRAYEGEEVEPAVFVEAVEEIARADASTAWCVAQGSGCSMAAAYLEPAVARAVFGSPDAVMASGPSTANARAIVVDGGYRVSGTWMFASGSRHSSWLAGHCTVCEADGSPRLNAEGKPIERTMIFPKSSAVVTDVWQVLGLKGTGSDNYAVADLFVPANYSFTRESTDDRREKGPLYRFTSLNLFGFSFAGVALGVARAMLEDFKRLAQTKKPHASNKVLRENAVIQSGVAIAEARLRASRALLFETMRALWETACAGEGFSLEQRASMRMSSTYAIQQAREIVEFAYHAAGATAIFESQPFERRLRDMHAVSQQVQGHAANFEAVGQVLLGLQPAGKL